MKYLLFLFVAAFFSSCEKESSIPAVPCHSATNEKTVSLQLFKGRWNWVSELLFSQREGNYIVKTPATEGYTRQLVFRNTTELEFFKNNISVDKYLYDVNKESTLTFYPGDSSNVLIFRNYTSGVYEDYVHFKVCNDTLTLNFQMTTDFAGVQKWTKE